MCGSRWCIIGVCFIILQQVSPVMAQTVLGRQTDPSLCPKGWIHLVSSCYYFNATKTTMSRARSSCQNQGGDLVLPLNTEEQNAIWKVAKEKKLFNPWIGLVERQKDKFYSLDGKTPSYTNWGTSQPNTDETEKCVVFWYLDENSKWHDVQCNNNYSYICQKTSLGISSGILVTSRYVISKTVTGMSLFTRLFSSYIASTIVLNSTVSRIGQPSATSSLMVSQSELRNSTTSSGQIRSITINPEPSQSSIPFYTGIVITPTLQSTLPSIQQSPVPSILQSSVLATPGLATKPVLMTSSIKEIPVLKTSTFIQASPTTSEVLPISTVSVVVNETVKFKQVASIQTCADKWKGWSNSCYLFVTPAGADYTQTSNWSMARAYCKERGADLVSLTTNDEVDFVYNHTKNWDYRFWNGLIYNRTKLPKNTRWAWSNGDKLNITKWDEKEPNYLDTEHCGEIIKWKKVWNNVRCTVYKKAWICEKPKSVPVTGTNCAVKTTSGVCCVFPFYYEMKLYQSCTTVDYGNKLWCATTSNYDKDRKWGDCKITQVLNSTVSRIGQPSATSSLVVSQSELRNSTTSSRQISSITINPEPSQGSIPFYTGIVITPTLQSTLPSIQQSPVPSILQSSVLATPSLATKPVLITSSIKEIPVLNTSTFIQASPTTSEVLPSSTVSALVNEIEKHKQDIDFINNVNTSTVNIGDKTTIERILNAAANLINTNLTTEDEKQDPGMKAVQVVEHLGNSLAQQLDLGNQSSFETVAEDLVFGVAVINTTTPQAFSFPINKSKATGDEKIDIPSSVFVSESGKAYFVGIIFKAYREMRNNTGGLRMGTKVINAIVSPPPSDHLNKPVEITFKKNIVNDTFSPNCLFWIENSTLSGDYGRWSTRGCSRTFENQSHIKCACNHLTNFAVLFNISDDQSPVPSILQSSVLATPSLATKPVLMTSSIKEIPVPELRNSTTSSRQISSITINPEPSQGSIPFYTGIVITPTLQSTLPSIQLSPVPSILQSSVLATPILATKPVLMTSSIKEIPVLNTSTFIQASPTTSEVLPISTVSAVVNETEKFKQVASIQTCADKWKGWSNSCYLFVTPAGADYTQTSNWSMARAYCKERGADLVSLTTNDEVDFVYNHTKNLVYRFWNGLRYNRTKLPKNTRWAWSNGDKLNITKWNEGEPNNLDTKVTEHCGEIIKSEKLWNNLPCSYPIKAWICEKPKRVPVTGTNCAVKTTSGVCCVFPFYYEMKLYQSCTTVDYGNKLWCATTSDYDKDRKWGDCKITQVLNSTVSRIGQPPATSSLMVSQSELRNSTTSSRQISSITINPQPSQGSIPFYTGIVITPTLQSTLLSIQQSPVPSILQSSVLATPSLATKSVLMTSSIKEIPILNTSTFIQASPTTSEVLPTDKYKQDMDFINNVDTSTVNISDKKTIERILNAAANLINTNLTTEDEKQDPGMKAVQVVEHLGNSLAQQLDLGNQSSFETVAEDLVFGVAVINTTTPQALSFPTDESKATGDEKIDIPSSVFVSESGKAYFVGIIFKAHREMRNNAGGLRMGTKVINAIVSPPPSDHLNKPVEITFKKNNVNDTFSPNCSFWIENSTLSGDYGRWSTRGCSRTSVENQSHIKCECNHLTNFAVLFKISDDQATPTASEVLPSSTVSAVVKYKEAKDFINTVDTSTVNINNTMEIEKILNYAAYLLNTNLTTDDEKEDPGMKAVQVLENLGENLARKLDLGNKSYIEQVAEDLVFGVAVITTTTSKELFSFPSDESKAIGDEKIEIPISDFGSKSGKVYFVCIIFKAYREMNMRSSTGGLRIGTKVINAKLLSPPKNPWDKPLELRNLSFRDKPVEMTFEKDIVNKTFAQECSFWKENSKDSSDYGRWLTRGCSMIRTFKNQRRFKCACDHLTNFAVLFKIDNQDLSEEDEFRLEIITYVGLSLSILGCLLTFIIYISLSGIKSDRAIIHTNLVLALGIADVIFLVTAAVNPDNDGDSCLVVAMLAFYFYLCVFFWMLVEGAYIYLMVIKVFRGNVSRRRKIAYLVGWGCPMIIAVITWAVLRGDVVSKYDCWLSVETGAIWAFVGPGLAIILTNLIILLAVMRTTWVTFVDDQEYGGLKSATKTFGALIPILGITWVFGIMAFNESSLAFQYIFAITNSLQGALIFILYCIVNNEVRNELRRRITVWQTRREMSSSSGGRQTTYPFIVSSEKSTTFNRTIATASAQATPNVYHFALSDMKETSPSGRIEGRYSFEDRNVTPKNDSKFGVHEKEGHQEEEGDREEVIGRRVIGNMDEAVL